MPRTPESPERARQSCSSGRLPYRCERRATRAVRPLCGFRLTSALPIALSLVIPSRLPQRCPRGPPSARRLPPQSSPSSTSRQFRRLFNSTWMRFGGTFASSTRLGCASAGIDRARRGSGGDRPLRQSAAVKADPGRLIITCLRLSGPLGRRRRAAPASPHRVLPAPAVGPHCARPSGRNSGSGPLGFVSLGKLKHINLISGIRISRGVVSDARWHVQVVRSRAPDATRLLVSPRCG